MTVSPDSTIKILDLPVRLELKHVLRLLRAHQSNLKTRELAADLQMVSFPATDVQDPFPRLGINKGRDRF